MTSSTKKRAIILFTLSTLSHPLSAVSTSNLMIKPSVCMVKKPGDSCQMTVTVQWQNDNPIDACLYQNDARLTCWQNAHNINTKIVGNVSQLEFNGYNYKDLDVNGQFQNKKFDGLLIAKDENFKLKFEGLADLSLARNKFDFRIYSY